MNLVIRPTTLGDCLRLAPELRAADLAEIAAATGRRPLLELLDGRVCSPECRTIHDAEGPIAVFGVTRTYAPWLLGSDRIRLHWREFARRSREELEAIRPAGRRLANHVHVANTVHVRWLRWLGAELADPVPYGVAGEPFYPFTL